MNSNTNEQKEVSSRRSGRYIRKIKHVCGRTLESTREISEKFQEHFKECFTKLLNLLVQEFGNYLTDSLHLEATRLARYEFRATEPEALAALKWVHLFFLKFGLLTVIFTCLFYISTY